MKNRTKFSDGRLEIQTVIEEMVGEGKDQLPVTIVCTADGIAICPKGYDDANKNHAPIFIDLMDGEPRVSIWRNIQIEDPTVQLDLRRARVEFRRYGSLKNRSST